jgi:hypothetical protein
LVEGEKFEQGDFFFGFPVIMPIYPEHFYIGATDADADVKFFDVIVLSQSCDWKYGKAENVLVFSSF